VCGGGGGEEFGQILKIIRYWNGRSCLNLLNRILAETGLPEHAQGQDLIEKWSLEEPDLVTDRAFVISLLKDINLLILSMKNEGFYSFYEH
jgi:hypothetical protein